MSLVSGPNRLSGLSTRSRSDHLIIMKAIVVAGTHSGVGKTSVAVGLMAAFRRRGLRVQPFKVGPDFLDPMHHQAATGRDSYNLDGWMLNREANVACFTRFAASTDVAVVEGVMGLFDGRDGKTEVGSTAEMAKIIGAPVVLVLDCWSMSRSAAAMVHGYASFDPSLRFAGIILNKVASAAHATWLTEALESAHVRVPVLGGIPKSADVEMPERHLGLHRPGVEADGVPAQHAERLAMLIEAHVDLDRLLQLAADVAGAPTMGLGGGEGSVCGGEDVEGSVVGGGGSVVSGMGGVGGGEYGGSSANELPPLSMPPGMKLARIGVARDEAFCFYYHDNLSLLREAGAEIVFFSPLTDPMPHRLDAVYFGGGYPELHAAALAANTKLVYALRAFAAAGGVVYGECGGLMYLSRSIETKEGEVHEMCGLLPFRTRMVSTLKLAYCTVRPQPNCVLFPAELGELRGQFFHFSEVVLDDGSFHGDQLEFG
ncbi:unnamed protein product [Closterium sp. Yama58-4]|nr:unnamed protein product [Closterium sp. Yama58-4]